MIYEGFMFRLSGSIASSCLMLDCVILHPFAMWVVFSVAPAGVLTVSSDTIYLGIVVTCASD